MKTKLALFFVAVSIAALFTPSLARAQTAADTFVKYTNPHDICNYYRTQASGFAVERVSDNECLVSLGTGKYKTFTQYYYSGNDWCYKLIQEGKTVYGNCMPIPKSSSLNISEESVPYIIAGVVIFVFIIAFGAAHKPPVNPAQPSPTAPTKAFRQRTPVRGKRLAPKKKSRIWPELKFKRKK